MVEHAPMKRSRPSSEGSAAGHCGFTAVSWLSTPQYQKCSVANYFYLYKILTVVIMVSFLNAFLVPKLLIVDLLYIRVYNVYICVCIHIMYTFIYVNIYAYIVSENF